MKIIRVEISPDGKFRESGDIIEKSFLPDETILLNAGDEKKELVFSRKGSADVVLRQVGFSFEPRKIMRYFIEGKARIRTVKTVDGERTEVENAKDECIGEAYSARLVFSISGDERILGLGQHEDGVSNYRNCTQHLYQNNMQIPMPVFVSTAGYGVLIDADCLMVYEEKDNLITLSLDAMEQLSYYVILGEDMKEAVAGVRRLTGKAAMLPRWAFGYVQSRERYHSQAEILDTAAEFSKRQIPVSCLVQDWLTWAAGKWGDKHPDPERYPDLKGMTDALHQKGIAFMVSVWPNMNRGGADNTEMMEAGKLFANLSTYDAFDEEARRLYWQQCERDLFAGGTDAWWCDSTEPFTPDWNGSVKKSAQERYELTKETQTRYMDARKASAYALYHARGICENQRRSAPGKRVVNLTRSGYPSIQKYGAILWSGDIAATWEVFRSQVVEGQQMAASAIPYWTLDTGAFFTGNQECWKRWSGAKEGVHPWFWHGDYEDGVSDKGYCELYVRWLQYAAFLPIMRSHGTDTPREPWQFEKAGQKYYDTIVRYIRLRYRLVPYIYSLAWQVWKNDAMMMRALVFDYPLSEEAAQATDEYLFGDFLVCPVTYPMEYGPDNTPLKEEQTRPVYLPEDGWYDYETKEYLAGGREIMAEAPVEHMPLYIRAGSIVPVSEKEDCDLYHEQRPQEMTLEVYTGKDAAFTCYFDRGDGYEYQDGVRAEVPVSWEEESGQLIFGEVQGEYPYPEKWTVRFYTPRKMMETEILYQGKEITLYLDREEDGDDNFSGNE